MTVRLEIHQARTVEEGPEFKVATSVTYASGINRNIFVFNTETEDFEHVATVYDMEQWLADRDDAIEAGDNYYRKDAAIVGYEVQETAADAASYTLERIEYLANQYNLMRTTFEGAGDYTYIGEET